MSTTIAPALARTHPVNSRSGQRDPVTDDLVSYIRVLADRFAKHCPAGGRDGRCRCGRARPCPEEQQIAYLMELAWGAGR